MTNTLGSAIRREEKPDTQWLKELAIYLEGYKKGRNDLHPLGDHHLKTLWDAIKYINNQP